jgi:hypothetical protein
VAVAFRAAFTLDLGRPVKFAFKATSKCRIRWGRGDDSKLRCIAPGHGLDPHQRPKLWAAANLYIYRAETH